MFWSVWLHCLLIEKIYISYTTYLTLYLCLLCFSLCPIEKLWTETDDTTTAIKTVYLLYQVMLTVLNNLDMSSVHHLLIFSLTNSTFSENKSPKSPLDKTAKSNVSALTARIIARFGTCLVYLTWWRFQEWVAPCPPEHTSSNLWTCDTALLCKGHQGHNPGWKWPRGDSAEPHPGRFVSPGHKREPSLKPQKAQSVQSRAFCTFE